MSTPSLDEKPIPQSLIDERWIEKPSRWFTCTVHHTFFFLQKKPCWQCYNEVQAS